jgi:hypothetical protein
MCPFQSCAGHEPLEWLVVSDEGEMPAMQKMPVDLDTPHCCQTLTLVRAVVPFMLVERPGAAGDQILIAGVVALAEHSAQTNVAEIDVQVDGTLGVETLDSFVGFADLSTDVVHSCTLLRPKSENSALA